MTYKDFKKLKKTITSTKDFKPGDIVALGPEYSDDFGIVASRKQILEAWTNSDINQDTLKRDLDRKDKIWMFIDDDPYPRQCSFKSHTIKVLTPTEKILYWNNNDKT